VGAKAVVLSIHNNTKPPSEWVLDLGDWKQKLMISDVPIDCVEQMDTDKVSSSLDWGEQPTHGASKEQSRTEKKSSRVSHMEGSPKKRTAMTREGAISEGAISEGIICEGAVCEGAIYEGALNEEAQATETERELHSDLGCFRF